MADQNLAQLLMQHGVNDKLSLQIQNHLDGADLTDLVNSLKLSNNQLAVVQANKILAQYGVNIKEAIMNNNHLYHMYRGLDPVTEAVTLEEPIEHMTAMSESNRSEDHILALEGFNYYTTLEPQLSEQLMDWLETNKVEFLTNGQGHFHVKCEDRDHAYKVGRTISGLMRRQRLVRDSSNAEGKQMAEKRDYEQRAKQAKEKLANLKPRNPNALAASMMQAKSGGPMNAQKKVDQKDEFGRNAKHKKQASEEIESVSENNVLVNGRDAVITIPKGPNGTVGVIMDGKLIMVSKNDIRRVDETVMNVTSVNPLFRLRELAGLPPSPLAAPSVKSSILNDPMKHMDGPHNSMPLTPIDSGMDDDIDPTTVSDMLNPDLDINPMTDPDMDMDTGLEQGSDIGMGPGDDMDMDPGIPSNIEVAGKPSETSSAMKMIDDHLNNVQLNLSEIKISEYKTLIRKLTDLTNQLQSMGKDYLGEKRLLKPIVRR